MAKRNKNIKRDGDYTSYTNRVYGPIRRRRGGPSGNQISTLASCAPLRKNNSLFGAASKHASLFRKAMLPVSFRMTDEEYVQRTVRVFIEIAGAALRRGYDENVQSSPTDRVEDHLYLFKSFVLNKHARGMFLQVRDSKSSKKKGVTVSLELSFKPERVPSKCYAIVKAILRHVDFTAGSFDAGEEVHVRIDAPGDDRNRIEVCFKKPLREKHYFIGFSVQLFNVVNNQEIPYWERTLYGGVVYWVGM